MKVIEGGFGKESEQSVVASDLLMELAKRVEGDENVEVAMILYVDGESMTTVSNCKTTDGVHMLLSLGVHALQASILSGGE